MRKISLLFTVTLLLTSIQPQGSLAQFSPTENYFESSISYEGQTLSVPGTLGLLTRIKDCDPLAAVPKQNPSDFLCHTMNGDVYHDPDAPDIQLQLFQTGLLPVETSQIMLNQFANGLKILSSTLDGTRSFATYGEMTKGTNILEPRMLQSMMEGSQVTAIGDVRVLKVNNVNVGLAYLAAKTSGAFSDSTLSMEYVFFIPKTTLLGVYRVPVSSDSASDTESFKEYVNSRLKEGTPLEQLQQFDTLLEAYAKSAVSSSPTYAALLASVGEMIGSAKTTPFIDVFSSTEFAEAILAMRGRGIIGGYADGTYKPKQSVNRAEFMKILLESKKPGDLASYASKCFPDVEAASWYTKYVCYGKEKGIISGYDDGSFRPESSINLAEALKITFKTYDISVGTSGAWYEPFLDEARRRGMLVLITAEVSDSLTRGEMAELVYRLLASQ